MNIVTGGAGFIGSNIVAAMQLAGYEDIVVIDTLGTEDKWRNLAKRQLAAIVPPQDTFSFLSKHATGIQSVIHMGAISTTTERDVDLIIQNNFALSCGLWDFCALHGIPFIYASSAATYGDGSQGFCDDETIPHLQSLRPLNPYGWSKSLFDLWVARQQQAGHTTPPQFAGLKFFNVYGPNEYHKGGQKSVVAHIFPLALAHQQVQLFKSYHPDYQDGWQLRDFVYVDDCVNVILWLLRHSEVSGLFNIGSGQARSFFDLATATFAALGHPPNIGFKPMPEELQGKYQYFTQADTNKLWQVGYTTPPTSLEDGIEAYVQRYLNTSDPYR